MRRKSEDSIINETIEFYRLSYAQSIVEQDSSEERISPAIDFFIASLPEKSLVLEQGCGIGYGLFVRIALAGHSVEGFDISPEAIKILTNRLRERDIEPSSFNLWVQDIRDFDYPLQHYDGIVDHYTLHHFPVPLQKDIITKVFHSLKPQGLFFFGLNFSDQFRRGNPHCIFGDNGRVTIDSFPPRHYYPWDIHSLESFLESVGFRVVLTFRGTKGGFCDIVCQNPQKRRG